VCFLFFFFVGSDFFAFLARPIIIETKIIILASSALVIEPMFTMLKFFKNEIQLTEKKTVRERKID
jgi:hypothetical protein